MDIRVRHILIYYYLRRKAQQKVSLDQAPATCIRKTKKRRFWVRPIFQVRQQLGAGHTLVNEMRLNPENRHFNFLRMDADTFDELLLLVGPHLKKSDLGREPINPQTRLIITLRYLASGDSQMSQSYLFRVGKSTVSNIIAETVEIIWKVLQPLVLAPPDERQWKEISKGFESKWHFPNCVGAIDGKHISIQAPPHAGSTYYNYKGNHSLVLMAVVGDQYQFVLVDIGAQGRQSDGGIFKESLIGKKINNKSLSIPPPRTISEGRPPLPYVIVGDEAFPLLENLMRPFPGKSEYELEKRIYNYRHSRARRISENAFGILVARWRIFGKQIIGKIDNIENIVKACVCLHNFLIKHDTKTIYITPNLVDYEENGTEVPGRWRQFSSQLTALTQTGSNMYTINAREVRDIFKDYFSEEGAVPWQWDIL